MAYLLLGDLAIAVESVLGLNYSFKQNFAEQEKIEAPPTLQLVGRELSELKLTCRFSFMHTNPDQQIALLLAACDVARPLAFIDGSGNYKGNYVLESVDVAPKKTNGQGRSLSVDVDLSLKEWRSAAPPEQQIKSVTLSPFKKAVT